jgi:uncharacterized membrane protein HdeD (DUF308 family)
VTETARVLLTAVILSATALSVFAWRVTRTAPGAPDRLVAQLHLSQWAALILAVQGALTMGLAVSSESAPGAALELAMGLVPVIAAILVLRSEPSPALQLAAFALGVHAAMAFAHRPGWLAPDLAPTWFWVGQLTYDLYIATLCSISSRK